MNIKPYIKLIRPKHYLKNVLVFLPLIFSGNLFNYELLVKSVYSFIAFSALASVVYIINDLRDIELDKKHPKKKYRPLAAGTVSSRSAVLLAVILVGLTLGFQYLANFSVASLGLLCGYLFINLLYSFGLKNIPILDVLILSLGFVLRVLYGGSSVGIEISKWLYLAILAFSFYLGLGKRRNEIRSNGSLTRKVNNFYNQEFLDKNMYVCLGLTITYYSLWAVDPSQENKLMFWTIPLVLAIVMAYSLAVEAADSDGDPVSVVFAHKHLLGMISLYGVLMIFLVYI